MSQEQSTTELSNVRQNIEEEEKTAESKISSKKTVRGSKQVNRSVNSKVSAENSEDENVAGVDEEALLVGEAYTSSNDVDELGFTGSFNEVNSSGAAFLESSFGGATNSFSAQEGSSAVNYATDAQGFFQDPNPQVIKRPAIGGPQVATQRITVRFLQPPPLPESGPLIIKEVRPPQPPLPPPLYIRQRPPPLPPLPPIVIRERPPKLPPPVPAQVITKVLPPIPVPPRSVIIERLAPLPPKPRDIIVERWLPYRTAQKRRVIIQRAPPAPVQKPRNIIIYYEAPKARIVRRFENLGVQSANPNDYVARFGTQLEDSQSLISHARQAGVIEDISPPLGGGLSSVSGSASYGNYQTSNINAGAETFASGYEFSSDSFTTGNNQFGAFEDFSSGSFGGNLNSFNNFNQSNEFIQGFGTTVLGSGGVTMY